MTFVEMKKAVAAFATRSTTSFTVDSLDILSLCINQARKWCERDNSFELAKVPAYIDVDLTNGGSLASAYLYDGAGTPNAVTINEIEQAYLTASGGGTFPVDVVSRGVHRRRMLKTVQNVETVAEASSIRSSGLCGIALVRHGGTVYLVPANPNVVGTSPVRVYMDIVRWMPDYVADADTDFFLRDMHDLILMRSLFRLNFYLKQDERVQLDMVAMQQMWVSALAWDARQHTGANDMEY